MGAKPIGKPEHIASPLQIMIEGPWAVPRSTTNSAAATWAVISACSTRRWARAASHPPWLSQAHHDCRYLGTIDATQTKKIVFGAGTLLIQLGGPGMRIGMAGAGFLSMAAGTNSAALDFDSVQRGNPEIERRAQR